MTLTKVPFRYLGKWLSQCVQYLPRCIATVNSAETLSRLLHSIMLGQPLTVEGGTPADQADFGCFAEALSLLNLLQIDGSSPGHPDDTPLQSDEGEIVPPFLKQAKTPARLILGGDQGSGLRLLSVLEASNDFCIGFAEQLLQAGEDAFGLKVIIHRRQLEVIQVCPCQRGLIAPGTS